MNDTGKFVVGGLAGERPISGEIRVGGAKNEALKALAAAILFRDGLTISNVPDIEDVGKSLGLLEGLGIKATKTAANTYRIDTSKIKNAPFSANIAKHFRASIVFTGPVLARFGEVQFPFPGGCVIGKRPIDFFLDGYRRFGAVVEENEDNFTLRTPQGLKGTEIFFRNQSVTGTETLMMAAILAKGTTILKNCALEPETIHLGEFLRRCGAKIEGLGTPTLTIEGGELLTAGDNVYEIIPDRIEAGSFLIIGALCAQELKITNCRPEHLDAEIELLKIAGAEIETGDDYLLVRGAGKRYQGVEVKTHEYPGFPTDLQAPMAVFLTQAEGQSFIFETIWENRLNYLEGLNRMGAKTRLLDSHRAYIDGPTPLSGKEMESPDLRAGLAYLIAALVAKGQSVVHNAYFVDRGYERIEERLSAIGFDIKREI